MRLAPGEPRDAKARQHHAGGDDHAVSAGQEFERARGERDQQHERGEGSDAERDRDGHGDVLKVAADEIVQPLIGGADAHSLRRAITDEVSFSVM